MVTETHRLPPADDTMASSPEPGTMGVAHRHAMIVAAGLNNQPPGTIIRVPAPPVYTPEVVARLIRSGRAVWVTDTGEPTVPAAHAEWDRLTAVAHCGC